MSASDDRARAVVAATQPRGPRRDATAAAGWGRWPPRTRPGTPMTLRPRENGRVIPLPLSGTPMTRWPVHAMQVIPLPLSGSREPDDPVAGGPSLTVLPTSVPSRSSPRGPRPTAARGRVTPASRRDSVQSASALMRLQSAHRSWRFFTPLEPPRATGMTWSNSSSRSVPHSVQRPPSRSQTRARSSRGMPSRRGASPWRAAPSRAWARSSRRRSRRSRSPTR